MIAQMRAAAAATGAAVSRTSYLGIVFGSPPGVPGGGITGVFPPSVGGGFTCIFGSTSRGG
jgi:hypothetical protein